MSPVLSSVGSNGRVGSDGSVGSVGNVSCRYQDCFPAPYRRARPDSRPPDSDNVTMQTMKSSTQPASQLPHLDIKVHIYPSLEFNFDF